ncbi:MAG: adenylyltransferase/cytidyltransferase family protein [Lentisphaeria bacterium]|nr:adenylyltransferase/cytidyltransferase family protein [Lentisphaeria bacterium]
MQFQDPQNCILSLDEAVKWRQELRSKGKKLVITNGCFDLVHRGHASYLRKAAEYGDELLVLINSDASVRQLKGDSRPLVSELDRGYLLCSLKAVSKVVIFDSQRCSAELTALAPDVYVKAGDYTLESLDPSERNALVLNGTEIIFAPFVGGFSTTNIVEKIRRSM